jgi:hypothetical protein
MAGNCDHQGRNSPDCGQPSSDFGLIGHPRAVRDSEAWAAEIMARQDGVLSRKQAIGAGMTQGQIRHRLETGRWTMVHPSVYRSADHQFTDAARVRSAGLWGGANALISGIAAAYWWGLPTPAPKVVEVVIPPNEHRRSRPGTRIVRRRVPRQDRMWVSAAPVTSLALSVMVASVQLGQDGPAVMIAHCRRS